MFSGCSAARLPGYDYLAALLAKAVCELFELRAFPASIEAFKGDEQTAMGMSAHEKNHSRGRRDSEVATAFWVA